MVFRKQIYLILLLLWSCCVTWAQAAGLDSIGLDEHFTEQDAILVVKVDGRSMYRWRADQLMIPASLNKILTSYLAIEKWGLSHQFKTEFYRNGSELWVKGYGDPYLTSEEIEKLAITLTQSDLDNIKSVHVDASYFEVDHVPGRSLTDDPYNAPLSAVAANFNTVYLQQVAGELLSAEPQTPLTRTARKIAGANSAFTKNGNKTRINLVNSANAQSHFAELLTQKLGLNPQSMEMNGKLPSTAILIHQHRNSEPLSTALRATMTYSNNFIANQLFLKLADNGYAEVVDFNAAQKHVDDVLKKSFSWPGASIVEGAGLSRDNSLTAEQVDDLLQRLAPYQHIFKEIEVTQPVNTQVDVHAKTGTLNGVRNYAGYINFPHHQYRFVFMFNRTTPYRYRDTLLQSLIQQLSVLEPS